MGNCVSYCVCSLLPNNYVVKLANLKIATCSICSEPLGSNGVCLACLLRAGLAEANEMSAASGTIAFGDFEILRRDDGSLCELGRGAMGVTYRARDIVLHRDVALKVIKLPAFDSDSEAMQERFLREARAAAGLRHTNVAGVFQFGMSPDHHRCYCAMELVEGETLEALIRRQGPMKSELVLEVALQVTRALNAAAERGLVHRDLKPSNIMLASTRVGHEPQVKVIDFGLAKAANATGKMELTHNGFVGTPAFASPEQFAQGAIDARTDIYALGVTIWFALTGRLPFPGTTIEEIRERQACGGLPIEQLAMRGVPPSIIDLLGSCLALDPANRPASAQELIGELEESRARLTRSRPKIQFALAGVGCALLLLAAGAFWWLRSQSDRVEQASALPVDDSIAPVKPTEDSNAYLLFLRARETESNGHHFREALDLYEQAIALDPKFALAWARASMCASQMAHERDADELRLKARNHADQALRLQPDLGEAHLALADCYIFDKGDPDPAMAELKRAATHLPNSVEVLLTTAWVRKRQGKFRDRITALRRAEALDPRAVDVRSSLILTCRWVRDWKGAIEALDRRFIVAKGPTFSILKSPWSRANDEFRLTGELEALKKALAEEERQPATVSPRERLNYERFEIATLERDYARGAEFLSSIPPPIFTDATGPLDVIASHVKPFHEALLAVARGADPSETREKLEKAENTVRAALRTAIDIDQAISLADLAILEAYMGRREEAIRDARRAVEDARRCATSVEVNDVSSALALVYAQTGETEKALDLIEHLLTAPCQVQRGAIYNMTLVDLRWRWVWDPLRNHPRFKKLVSGPEPKTIY